jgi:hypothetical protein
MLEREVIQMRGFRNIVENGTVTGFQFRIRLTYYRGAWLSLFRPGDVTVDKDVFTREKIHWIIGGKEYSLDEMEKIGDVQWHPSEAAIIKIQKPGGLSQGWHEITTHYRYIMSYVPHIVNSDEAFARMPARLETRKLLIV